MCNKISEFIAQCGNETAGHVLNMHYMFVISGNTMRFI